MTTAQRHCGPFLLNPLLRIAAEVVDDAEKTYNANKNRLRQLTRTGVDKDGKNRGFGLSETTPGVERLAALIEHQDDNLKVAVSNLEAELRVHPLWPWCRATTGVGAKQLGRLLGAIGDPYWNLAEDRPRKISELIAYCGFHVNGGIAPRRRRGEQTVWNEAARMRAWNIAGSCLKAKTSPYNPVYYKTRAKYEFAVHTCPCIQCGTKGKLAPIGSELRDGHKHARALRMVAVTVLTEPSRV